MTSSDGLALGHRVIALEECASTQLEAQKLAAEGAPHGTVVVARRQTAGRGRSGRQWLSEEGLYLSVVLRPKLSPERLPRLTLLAGAGVLDALLALGSEVYAKWPNDVLIAANSDGPLGPFRKVCGILVEGVMGPRGIEGAVLGVGVNLVNPPGGFPEELRLLAGAVSDVGPVLSRDDALRAVLTRLQERLSQPNDDGAFAAALDRLRERSATLGRRVEVRDDGVRGVAEALGDDGALLVRTDEGELVRVIAGDVWPRV